MHILFFLLGSIGALLPTPRAASIPPPDSAWGQKLPSAPKPAASKGGTAPFLPFFDLGAPAGPLRSDGTYKGRAPGDTLPFSRKDTYTTLDKLQKAGFKRGRKGPLKKIRGGLGGLDPEEVFYADEDLIIIKGGGFGGNSYSDPPPQEIESEGLFIPFDPQRRGGSISPPEEYNGNIPTIVPPPLSASRFSPLSLFLPQASQSVRQHTLAHSPLPGRVFKQCVYFYVLPERGWPSPHLSRYFTYPRVHYLPLRMPRPHQLQIHTTPVGHSLAGDTDVNHLNPKPEINPEAEVFIAPRKAQTSSSGKRRGPK